MSSARAVRRILQRQEQLVLTRTIRIRRRMLNARIPFETPAQEDPGRILGFGSLVHRQPRLVLSYSSRRGRTESGFSRDASSHRIRYSHSMIWVYLDARIRIFIKSMLDDSEDPWVTGFVWLAFGPWLAARFLLEPAWGHSTRTTQTVTPDIIHRPQASALTSHSYWHGIPLGLCPLPPAENRRLEDKYSHKRGLRRRR
ncbi:hypothetical protein B0H12DRAFT_829035 [Mycena haematopus]|nr:hypothetical protein B0H12DRAFT_829035 [Mycena haematopus]